MEYINIPRTDLQVSRVGLGTWAIGGWMWGGTDEAQSVQTIISALERGINLIDTAPVYGFGQSEELVGKAVARVGTRDKIVLATKAGLEWQGDQVHRNGSQERIEKEIEDSLRRLGTEYIDIYQIHWPDPRTRIEETARAMERLHQAGKIRAVGVSNYSPKQCEEFRKFAPLHTHQPPYNLFEREIENDLLPYTFEHNIMTLTYGALCRGLLSGRMRPDTRFAGDDLRQVDPKFQLPRYKHYLAAVDALDRYAREKHGRNVLALSVRSLLDHPGVGVALWGARRPDQLDAIDGVFGWHLGKDDFDAIDTILHESIPDPVGPQFMAPPTRKTVQDRVTSG